MIESYAKRGFRLVFYPSKRKGPTEKNWTSKEYPVEAYHEGQNVGVMTGSEISPGKFLADVDFDWTDGLILTRRLLPPTGFGFGRTTRPISHAFYTTPQPVVSCQFDNIDGKVFVELRGMKSDGTLGFQTMVPPSIHPSGERVELKSDGEIAHVEDLRRHVLIYAVGCILLCHLGPRGLLHDVRLALAGFLFQLKFTEAEVVRLGEAIAEITGNNVADVASTVRSTLEHIQRGERVTGSGVLLKAIGENGKQVLSKIREWVGEREFVTDKNDKPLKDNKENITRALEKLGVRLSYDLFFDRAIIEWPSKPFKGPTNDSIRNDIWLTIEAKFGFRPGLEYFFIVFNSLAREHSFHPILDYLSSLTWDQKPRLDEWLITYAGAADTPYTRSVGSLVLLAAVKRVVEPGCKFDELLVLESSRQGLLKSTAIRSLCPEEDWFSDDLPLNVDAKEVIERTAGKWIVEASELSGMRSSQMEHLKALLSRQRDGPVRLAYARDSVERARQFIMIGTTNSYHYLSDITGNRRFWPVRIKVFDIKGIRRDRDQLWAEAYHRIQQGASIRLPPELYEYAEFQQERRRIDHPWEQILKAHFEDKGATCRVAPDELWEILGIPNDRLTEAGQRQLSSILQTLDFRRMSVRNRAGKIVKGWARGPGKRDAVQLDILRSDEEAAREETFSED